MSSLVLENLHKTFGETDVIRGVDLNVESGEFVVFVGPSGCGKSTLLRLIAGLELVTSGSIELDGEDITETESSKRDLAMVFQSYALYPHMSVEQNMSFALRLAGEEQSVIDEKVKEAAEILQLDELLERKPKELSGGQRQRVAIGRSIVRHPSVFLFDEPLSNLDASLRVQMRQEISSLHQRLDATMIYVTHDQVEAMTLADKVVILNAGIIEQVGTPLEVYNNPNSRFVAEFIGTPKMNFIPMYTEIKKFVEDKKAGRFLDKAKWLGVRPESVLVGSGSLKGKVYLVEQLGSETLIYINYQDNYQIAAKASSLSKVKVGDVVDFDLDLDKAHGFDGDGNRISDNIAV